MDEGGAGASTSTFSGPSDSKSSIIPVDHRAIGDRCVLDGDEVSKKTYSAMINSSTWTVVRRSLSTTASRYDSRVSRSATLSVE